MRAFIGVGSNIAPEDHILQALLRLSRIVRLAGVSTFYRTEALEHPEQPAFFNGVVAVDTKLEPLPLKFTVLRHIEAELGRERGTDRYAPRPIDLDLLLYGDLVLADESLTIPDPEIAHRAFLSIPLYELAPALRLPGSGLAIRDIAEHAAGETMQPLAAYTDLLRGSLFHEP